ncbi:hypothetical protein GUITHDRAFT_146498 [Guillardia theta CCMP2712]|uniref:Uncharacterized protein n=1 Tax=Guillardia theta (strain CCMP2712) TaxID=905079 RepID=L1IHI9_GUITC|nr:hypothetical protein GUITHDRAFT_146498 [Guillardia theta CCMP2712]EKX35384.1 hypothetical protein GUITHDRAFT_146498 [Guillardia theta CCMP2712]|eukprot:XP_005822364.1 hypothetical protein GUITHDRAFT_146498 [Guillardia theta CCMP2712]
MADSGARNFQEEDADAGGKWSARACRASSIGSDQWEADFSEFEGNFAKEEENRQREVQGASRGSASDAAGDGSDFGDFGDFSAFKTVMIRIKALQRSETAARKGREIAAVLADIKPQGKEVKGDGVTGHSVINHCLCPFNVR